MLPYSMEMDIQSGLAPNNFDEVRGRTLSFNGSISSDISMSSTKSSVVYHERMTTNNVNNNDNPVDVSPELSVSARWLTSRTPQGPQAITMRPP